MLLKRYLQILKTHWFGIVACTLLGVLAAGAVAMLSSPTYTARTSLYISAQNGNDAMSAYQGGMFTQQRVKSYTELIQGERVASEVATALNLSDPPEDVARQISATSTLNTVVIDVAVTDASPQRAALIANAVGEVFPRLVSTLEQPTDQNALPTVKASVVQPASIPTRPSSTPMSSMIALGLLAGLVVGLVYAAIRNSLATAEVPRPAVPVSVPPPVMQRMAPPRYAPGPPVTATQPVPPTHPAARPGHPNGEQPPPFPPSVAPHPGPRAQGLQEPTAALHQHNGQPHHGVGTTAGS